jgi:hypothetical protein
VIEPNTLNVCLGHLPFPPAHAHHIDVMVSPKMIEGANRLALVEDRIFGANGSALSEYAQLLWINEHLARLLGDLEYIRIFHYRRFVSVDEPKLGKPSVNLPWATVVTTDQLVAYDKAFDRRVTHELFNTPAQFSGGILAQYATSHVIQDMMYFSAFLVDAKVLSPVEVSAFLRENIHIPSCNIGVFTRKTFTEIFGVLRVAAEFLSSRHFIVREGYQRRNVGFLLERLNSFLILQRIRAGLSAEMLGHNIVVSDSEVVSATN